jgi:hypothetical protein
MEGHFRLIKHRGSSHRRMGATRYIIDMVWSYCWLIPVGEERRTPFNMFKLFLPVFADPRGGEGSEHPVICSRLTLLIVTQYFWTVKNFYFILKIIMLGEKIGAAVTNTIVQLFAGIPYSTGRMNVCLYLEKM